MKKLYPVVSQLMSAGLVAALYIYIKLSGAFILGRTYYYFSNYGLVWELGSVVVASMIVGLAVERWKPSAGKKAIIIAAITIVPYFFIKFFL